MHFDCLILLFVVIHWHFSIADTDANHVVQLNGPVLPTNVEDSLIPEKHFPNSAGRTTSSQANSTVQDIGENQNKMIELSNAMQLGTSLTSDTPEIETATTVTQQLHADADADELDVTPTELHQTRPSCEELSQDCIIISSENETHFMRTAVVKEAGSLSPLVTNTTGFLHGSGDMWTISLNSTNYTLSFNNSSTTSTVSDEIALDRSRDFVLLAFHTKCMLMQTTRHEDKINDSSIVVRNTTNDEYHEYSFDELIREAVSTHFGIHINQTKVVVSGTHCTDTPVVIVAVSILTESVQHSFNEHFRNRSTTIQFESLDTNELVFLINISAEIFRNDSLSQADHQVNIESWPVTLNKITKSYLDQLFNRVSSIVLIVLFVIVGSIAIGTGVMSAITYAYFYRKYYRKFVVRQHTLNRHYSSRNSHVAILHDVITPSPKASVHNVDKVNQTRGVVCAFDIGRDNDIRLAIPNENTSTTVSGYGHTNDVTKMWSLSKSTSISRCLQTFSRLPEVSDGHEDRKHAMASSNVVPSLHCRDPSTAFGVSDMSRRPWKANPVFVDGESTPARTTWSVLEFSDSWTGPAVTIPKTRSVQRERVTPF